MYISHMYVHYKTLNPLINVPYGANNYSRGQTHNLQAKCGSWNGHIWPSIWWEGQFYKYIFYLYWPSKGLEFDTPELYC